MPYFLLALQLLFIGLKLTDIIDWSWWLVMLPLIFQGTIAFCFFCVLVYYAGTRK